MTLFLLFFCSVLLFLFFSFFLEDINECTLGTANCASGGVSNCTNTIGSYYCTCNTGYSGTGVVCTGGLFLLLTFAFSFAGVLDGVLFMMINLDINECTSGTANCAPSPTANCTNTIGSYTCACNNGYNGTGIVCSGLFLRFLQFCLFFFRP